MDSVKQGLLVSVGTEDVMVSEGGSLFGGALSAQICLF